MEVETITSMKLPRVFGRWCPSSSSPSCQQPGCTLPPALGWQGWIVVTGGGGGGPSSPSCTGGPNWASPLKSSSPENDPWWTCFDHCGPKKLTRCPTFNPSLLPPQTTNEVV